MSRTPSAGSSAVRRFVQGERGKKRNMQRVRVEAASSAYDVVIDPNGLGRAAEYIRPLTGERRLFVVADERVWEHHGARLEAGLADLPHVMIPLHGGEERKRLAQIESLAEQMYAAGADRSACVIAFGGVPVRRRGVRKVASSARGRPWPAYIHRPKRDRRSYLRAAGVPQRRFRQPGPRVPPAPVGGTNPLGTRDYPPRPECEPSSAPCPTQNRPRRWTESRARQR